MPGLQLRAGLGAGMGTSGGLMPAPSQMPTGPRQSTAAAYGMGAGINGGAVTPMAGTITAALASVVLLLALWWSLPR